MTRKGKRPNIGNMYNRILFVPIEVSWYLGDVVGDGAVVELGVAAGIENVVIDAAGGTCFGTS